MATHFHAFLSLRNQNKILEIASANEQDIKKGKGEYVWPSRRSHCTFK